MDFFADEGVESEAFFQGFEARVKIPIGHRFREVGGVAAVLDDMVAKAGEDFAFGMFVGQGVPAMGREGVILLRVIALAVLVVANNVRVNVINRAGVAVIDEIGGVSSRGAHIAF